MLEEDREAIRLMKADFEVLAEETDSVFKHHTSFQRRMDHYNTVYMCATRNASKGSEYPGYDAGELLYMDYQEMLTRHLLKFRDITAASDLELCFKVLDIWLQYKVLMKWNMRAFGYLSRYYIVNHCKPSLEHVALSIFLEQVFKKHAVVISRLARQWLTNERNGVSGFEQHITRAIDLLSAMSIDGTHSWYTEEFVKPYLAATKINYDEVVEAVSERAETPREMLIQLHACITDEQKRCQTYFKSEDEKLIMACIEASFVDSEASRRRLLGEEEGFRIALRNRDEEELVLCYQLFSRKDTGIAYMATLLKEEIHYEAEALCAAYAGEETAVDVPGYVGEMMKLQDVFPGLLSRCFQLQLMLAKAVREGVEAAYAEGVRVKNRVNGRTRTVLFCEWLSHYLDIVLQRGTADKSVLDDIEKIVSTLTYVTERDRFFANARDRLAERILHSSRFDESMERLFIHRTRQRCGPASTAAFEGMLHDLSVSNAFGAMDVLRARGCMPSFSVSLLVTKMGIWPPSRLGNDVTILVPHFLQTVLDNLSAAYLVGTSGRLLTWSHESASSELLWRIPGQAGARTLSVSGFQALILLTFNAHRVTRVTLQELEDRYKIPMNVLQSVIPPLLRSKVLQVQADANDDTAAAAAGSLKAEDALTVVDQFPSRKQTLRVAPTLVRISVANSTQLGRQVEEDRKPAIDACLVRIMKSRRVIEHAVLIEECQKQLEQLFVPEVRLIKLRIENLLRREYIERDGKTSYRYLA